MICLVLELGNKHRRWQQCSYLTLIHSVSVSSQMYYSLLLPLLVTQYMNFWFALVSVTVLYANLIWQQPQRESQSIYLALIHMTWKGEG